MPADIKPDTGGGCSVGKALALAASGVNLKGSAGQVYGWCLHNVGASVAYVKLYDKATAPVVGTDVPKLTIAVPAGVTVPFELPPGIPFANGIGWAATGAAADVDSSAPSGAIVATLLYF